MYYYTAYYFVLQAASKLFKIVRRRSQKPKGAVQPRHCPIAVIGSSPHMEIRCIASSAVQCSAVQDGCVSDRHAPHSRPARQQRGSEGARGRGESYLRQAGHAAAPKARALCRANAQGSCHTSRTTHTQRTHTAHTHRRVSGSAAVAAQTRRARVGRSPQLPTCAESLGLRAARPRLRGTCVGTPCIPWPRL
jgi:hypothetical protein